MSVAALAALAVSSGERDDASVSETTLDGLEADADDIAAAYGTTPYAETLRVVSERWLQTEAILDGRVGAHARNRIVTLGGMFSYYLARLAFNDDDMRSARKFARRAARYAREAREPVLVMSVACLQSSILYWRDQYTAALEPLHLIADVSHPYMNSRVAAYEARIHARLGDAPSTRAALDRMEATACTMAPRAGDTPVGAAGVAMFRAGLGRRIGDYTMAREWAPIALAGYRRRGDDYTVEEQQHAELDHALVLASGPRGEPEEAARLANSVLGWTANSPTHTIVAKAGELVRTFSADQRRLPAVAAFAETVHALPRGGQS
jgi:hypothetical protein